MSQTNLQAILKNLKDSLVVISLEYKILFANKTAMELLDDVDLVGKVCYEELFKRTEKCENCPIVNISEKSVCETQFEKNIMIPSLNRTKIFDIKASPIEDYNGQVAIIEILRDVTKRKALEIKIKEQADALLELSTPIISIWNNVIAVPLIGTLDSKRTMLVMENLLNKIVELKARIAIIDVTGVDIVDTQVANNLIKTIMAVRLLGAEAIITGIRPEVAQTIVNLGIELNDINTMTSLAEGLAFSFKKLDYEITRKTSTNAIF